MKIVQFIGGSAIGLTLSRIYFDSKMKFNLKKLISLLGLCFIVIIPFSDLKSQISGTVYRDYNGNGVKDPSEPLVAGVTVTAYNSANNICGTATTNSVSDPNYLLSGCSGTVRVEFVIPSVSSNLKVNSGYDYSSSKAAAYGSSVQFVTSNQSNVNFAINNPQDYWDNINQNNPGFAVPRLINGTASSNSGETGIVFVDNDDSGLTPALGTIANASEVGSIYGVAYQKRFNRFFYSSLTKRHVGFGPKGIGGLYISDGTGYTNYSISGGIDLQGISPVSGPAIDLGSLTSNNTV